MISKGQISVELQESMGDDRSIANAAWTSSLDYQSKKTRSDDDVKKVIELLATHKHCFDDKTEILTRFGWKFFKDLNPLDLVASVEQNTHKIIWTKPLEIISSDYEGDMYTVNSSMVNFKVTPNHDLYLSVKKNKNWLAANKYKPTEISIGPKKIYSCASELEEIDVSDCNKGKLYGFFLGDGFWSSSKTISFRLKKQRKIDYITELLNELGYKFDFRYTNDRVSEFKIIADEFIYSFGKEKASDKKIREFTFLSSPSFKYGVINGLKNSDGGVKRSAWFFSTTSASLVDGFRTLCSSLGFVTKLNKGKDATNIHKEQYRIMVLSRSTQPLFNDSRLGTENKMKIEQYSGKIYCVTVDTGLILVRRNDCQMISGNSVPFENIIFRFWIRMPIAIDRQFIVHRLQSASGLSGRYRTVPTDFLDIPDDVEEICKKIPQGDKMELANGNVVYGMDDIFNEYYDSCIKSNNVYSSVNLLAKDAWKKGLITNPEYKRIREFYRGVLPQHNMTERVSTINLRSFANFIRLRLKPEAQPEIQIVAELMLEEVKNKAKCPIAIEWLIKNNWNI